MQLGLIGLGRMGGNMATRLRAAGHEVVGFDNNPQVSEVADRSTPVRLSFAEGEVVIEAGGSEDARASEAMECEFTGDGLTVAFNPAYLLDGLSVLDAPQVLISFTSAMKPAVISPAGEDGEPVAGYRYLIMPMRVGG